MAEAVFFEISTGQRRGLFELFPFVVVCQKCEVIRHVKEDGSRVLVLRTGI
jgi:hypothetical protein